MMKIGCNTNFQKKGLEFPLAYLNLSAYIFSGAHLEDPQKTNKFVIYIRWFERST